MIKVNYYDDVHIIIEASESTMMDMHEYFSFYAEGYKFSPKYRAKIWNGKIHLLNMHSGKLYAGLLNLVYKFAELYDEDIEVDAILLKEADDNNSDIEEFIDNITLHSKGERINFYPHQTEAIYDGISKSRLTAVLPTSSGKSAIIYAWINYYLEKINKKILIIVPSTNLVEQLSTDFDDYYNGDFQDKYIHKIYSGKDKESEKKIIISTWQSIYKMPPKFFEQFQVCINDECHLAKGNSIRKVLESLPNCQIKLGLTGTLEKTPTNKLVIMGLFGEVKHYISTRELMDLGFVANLKIKNMIFKYNDEDCKAAKHLKYADEIKFIINHKTRNHMICKLVQAQTKNCLVLSARVQHCKDLAKQIKALVGDKRKVYCITGSTKVKIREEVRKSIEAEDGAVIVANFAIFSTGVSIKNIHSLIFASPVKSMIRTLQSIGRGLRISASKWKVSLYDIIDDFSYRQHKNYALKHYIERQQIYSAEKFEYSIHKINL